jgi:hypothetical protein
MVARYTPNNLGSVLIQISQPPYLPILKSARAYTQVPYFCRITYRYRQGLRIPAAAISPLIRCFHPLNSRQIGDGVAICALSAQWMKARSTQLKPTREDSGCGITFRR